MRGSFPVTVSFGLLAIPLQWTVFLYPACKPRKVLLAMVIFRLLECALQRRPASAKSDELLTGGASGLLGPKGRPRSDAWALTEFLMREKRLFGTLYYDEFAQIPMVSRSLADT